MGAITVYNPFGTSNPDGTQISNSLGGKQGDEVVSELHGKFYTASYRGRVFFGSVTGVTVPAVTSGLVSVCSLYNPPNSNVNLELIATTVGFTSATTVLDQIGWYWQGGSTFTVPTSITAGTPASGMLNGGKGVGQFLTAATHTGTPALLDYIVNMLTTSTVPPGASFKTRYDGEIILPPGSIISLAGSTAAWTSSHTDVITWWAEWPT
jgi:hypothetical protein